MLWLVDAVCTLHLPASAAAIVKGKALPITPMLSTHAAGAHPSTAVAYLGTNFFEETAISGEQAVDEMSA